MFLDNCPRELTRFFQWCRHFRRDRFCQESLHLSLKMAARFGELPREGTVDLLEKDL
jgi:hypothetical protein